MANFIEFELDANRSVHLNVSNVYKLVYNDRDNGFIFHYNYASTVVSAGDGDFTVSLGFQSLPTQTQSDAMWQLVKRVNSQPGGIVKASTVLGRNFYLKTEDGIGLPIAAPLLTTK